MLGRDSGEIILGLPGKGASVSSTNTVLAIEAEANKDDNQRTLAARPVTERHLFVLVDLFNHAPWCGMVDEEPPETPPRIPSEITDVWAAAQHAVTRGICRLACDARPAISRGRPRLGSHAVSDRNTPATPRPLEGINPPNRSPYRIFHLVQPRGRGVCSRSSSCCAQATKQSSSILTAFGPALAGDSNSMRH